MITIYIVFDLLKVLHQKLFRPFAPHLSPAATLALRLEINKPLHQLLAHCDRMFRQCERSDNVNVTTTNGA